jgi:hypothetical protein
MPAKGLYALVGGPPDLLPSDGGTRMAKENAEVGGPRSRAHEKLEKNH